MLGSHINTGVHWIRIKWVYKNAMSTHSSQSLSIYIVLHNAHYNRHITENNCIFLGSHTIHIWHIFDQIAFRQWTFIVCYVWTQHLYLLLGEDQKKLKKNCNTSRLTCFVEFKTSMQCTQFSLIKLV